MDPMGLMNAGRALLTTDNLIRAFGQLLVLIAATELGLRLLRPTSARLRLACWRGAIVAGHAGRTGQCGARGAGDVYAGRGADDR